MKCAVPGPNVKILAKAIHSLAKIGDEMYVEPQDKGISFRTVNMARSAYASFTFSESYFSYYTYGNLEEDDALRCQVTMRSAMAVFKAPSTLDRQVENCLINLDAKSCKLVFVLKYRNGITKTHFLPIIDCQILQAAFSQKSAPNQLTAHHKVMADAMLNFQPGLIEITLEVTPQKVLLRNYLDDTSDLSKITRTQLALGVGEFDQYKIGTDTSITFCVKEFKAVLNFAEAVSLPVSVHFETAGKPVIFIIKSSSFESNIVLSTLNPDSDSQSEATTVHTRNRTIPKKSTAKKRISKKPIEPAKRKAVNKYRTTKNTAATTSMETTNMEPKNGHRSTHRAEAMAVATNKDCSFAAFGDNVSLNTEVSYREASISEKSENGRGNINLTKDGRFSNNSSPGPSSKGTVKSIFSTIINSKARSPATLTTVSVSDREDIVPNSPPRHATKKARVIFNKCFQTTFDPRMLPGHDIVLAEDTDESD